MKFRRIPVESNRFLGIAVSRQQATVVCIDARSPAAEVVECFTVRPEQETGQVPSLAAAIGQAIRSRGLIYDQAALAMSSDFYAQYPVHSSFSEARQIEGTIRFDAEEATAADAATLAVTFEILRTEAGGSEVMVYSADRQTLTDTLLDLQSQGIDPVILEPDVVSMARVLDKKTEFAHDSQTLYVILGPGSCCFLRNANKGHAVYARRVLLAPQGDLTGDLARQMQMTLAGWPAEEPIQSIVLAGDTKSIDLKGFGQKVSQPVKTADLSLPGGSQTEPAQTAAAWGAALSHVTRGRKADFRRDFMPYQGRRRVLQKSLRIISVSLTLILLAAAVYFQFKTFRMNGYTTRLENKIAEEYKAAMYGQKPPPNQPILTRLRNVLRQAKQRQEGFGSGDDSSVVARLTFVLEAINKTPASVDVQVQQIAVTERSLRVQGDTNGRKSTLQLFDEMKKHPKLEVESNQLSPSPPRDKFEVTLQVEQEGGAQ
jgi:hypothetical protein